MSEQSQDILAEENIIFCLNILSILGVLLLVAGSICLGLGLFTFNSLFPLLFLFFPLIVLIYSFNKLFISLYHKSENVKNQKNFKAKFYPFLLRLLTHFLLFFGLLIISSVLAFNFSLNLIENNVYIILFQYALNVTLIIIIGYWNWKKIVTFLEPTENPKILCD